MSNPHNHTFLSVPSKRAALMSDHSTLSPPKRPKHHLPQPPPVPAGHASLRILCRASTVSAFIGKSGSTIKQLQSDTRSKIRVDDSLLPGSDRRVIVVVASSVPFKPVGLRNHDNEEVEYEEEVSALQEAALRVFEKLLEVSKEDEKTVKFGVLIDASQAGFVIGKGGKMVEKLKRDSGAKIRVLLGDSLPPDVSPLDEVVEIEGDTLSVKKGLLGVCGRLQQCPQEEKSSKKESKPVESTSQPTVRDYYVDPPLQRTPIYAMSASPAMVVRPLSYEVQRSPLYLTTTSSSPAKLMRPSSFETDIPAPVALKSQQEEVIFKLLCPSDRVGGVIGRGGSVVRALEDETGATITVGPAVANCDERPVTIISKEDVDSRYSPAQRAAVLVYSRSTEAAAVKGHEASSNKGSSIAARLLVPSNQVGCLLGKGGAVVSEMRKATGANISVLTGEQVPKCASEDEKVVEITGQFVKIQDALYQVTSRLRSNLFPPKVTGVPGSQTSSSLISHTTLRGRVRDQIPIGLHQSFATSQSIDALPTTRNNLDSLRQPIGRVRDQIPIDLHQSFATSQYIDGLPTTRHELDSLRHGRVRDQIPVDLHQSFATSQSIDGLYTTRRDLDSLLHSHRSDHSPSAPYRPSQVDIGVSHGSYVNLSRGLAPANGGIELGSANRPAVVTNTTVEISVPENAIGSVYGENGKNLTRIRQISGAKVSVHEPPSGARDWTIVISGSPEETQAAQSLLHAFILTGSS